MKPSAAEAADKGARPPGEMQAKTEKTKSSLKNVKKEVGKPEKLKYKPLTGKVFYLDIPSNVISEKIGKDLKELGGRVESFLSKDISYLVSSKKEAKFAPTLSQISPVPSPESVCNGGNSSPQPSNRKDRQDGSSFKAVDAVRLSRGKSLAEKAIREQELIPSGSILSNALSWGVKILHVDDVKHYIEQKKKELYLIKSTGSSFKDVGKQVTTQKSKSRLKNPFVKVEDRSRFYRPFYLQLPSFPVLNYCVPKPGSPFEVDKKHPSGQKQTQSKQSQQVKVRTVIFLRRKSRTKINSDKDCRIPVQLHQKDKKRRGYCECCGKKYEDLQTHLESEQHQNFAQSAQYQVVDDIISKFVYEFVEYRDDEKKVKRIKCSTGYFSPIVGKITRPDELKERLKKQRISLKTYSWKDTAMQALRLDRQPAEVQPNSVLVPTPISASFCSILYCHLSQPPGVRSKLRNHGENTRTDCFCATNLGQSVISSNFIQPLPQKDGKSYMENLSQDYEPFRKEILEQEENKKDLQCFQEGVCTLYSHTQVTDFSEKDKNLAQPKRKLNHAGVLPAKCLKKTDANPTFVEKHRDLCDNHQQMQHNVVLEAEVSEPAINKELNELAADTAHCSPSGKLHRKVKLCLGRNSRENRKQNIELCVKYADGLAVPREKRACSSPVQALLELFQTSEIKSEFGGFSVYTDHEDSTGTEDVWEGQNTNVICSLFSSSSSSPFVGF
ncbi:protein DBF4 homolog A isoform X2 [Numida meleagris]|uniref:protein DBF4 homolog A isoform X2 n=1 Tax=Numida meleagris TaxID=8996 RepID=UPI000B3D9894|nr:protein DBF4 homolog A isoform X2 [Numida meleagris]